MTVRDFYLRAGINRLPKLDREAAEILLRNGQDFINRGLNTLFQEQFGSVDAKFVVVDLQMGLELLLKFRLVRERGIAAILRSPKDKPSTSSSLKSGAFATITYKECLDELKSIENLSEYELSLLSEFQRMRNALVHFGISVNVEKISISAAHFILKPIQRVVYGTDVEEETAIPGARDAYISAENLARLIRFAPYVAEAERDAIASLDCDSVELCFNCGNRTLGVRPTEVVYCFCCGIMTDVAAVDWTDCVECGLSRSVAYDRLNESDNIHHGKCLKCDTTARVLVCPICGRISDLSNGSTSTRVSGLICLECAEDES